MAAEAIRWIRTHPGLVLIIAYALAMLALAICIIVSNPGQWPVDNGGGYEYIS